ncbi:MAG: toll/interleukin-1 receptor domain-containing protein [Dongiaceae bacterium]
MNHVFVSYKREDELRVGRIARALEAEGLEIWWDRGLPGGESWHSNIESNLESAGCVVVVWSAGSAGSEGGYVREEARHGLGRNILVPVLIDPLERLPLGFGEIQALDLVRWRGDRRDAFFQDLVATIRAKLANAPLPAPRGPTRRIARRLMWGSASGTALLFAVLLMFNSFGVATQICTLPGPQPALSDGCGNLGLGARPSRTERLAWESRAPGNCAALRDHIARFPDGAMRSAAADLLTARKTTMLETWEPATRRLALFEPAAGSPAKDEPAAQALALERGHRTAERLCRDFGAGGLYRYVGASAIAESWSCHALAAGTSCTFEGNAECRLEERRQAEQEICR